MESKEKKAKDCELWVCVYKHPVHKSYARSCYWTKDEALQCSIKAVSLGNKLVAGPIRVPYYEGQID